MIAYLYRPPTWRNVATLAGPLRVGITTSTCVYRRGGVWHNVLDAGEQDVDNIDVWTAAGDPTLTLRLFFTRPTVVPEDLFAELSALPPSNSSWTPGELVDLSVLDGAVTEGPPAVDGGGGGGGVVTPLADSGVTDNGDGTFTGVEGDFGDGTFEAPFDDADGDGSWVA